MKFSQITSGIRVIKQVIDWLQSSKIDAIRDRFADVFDDGVIYGRLNSMNIVGKDIDSSLSSFFHVKVDTGIAYKSGERIAITSSGTTYSLSNITHTTGDGIGGTVSTPRSTGSYNISLTTGQINYVYVAYLQIVDDSVFSLHKQTNAKIFYKVDDGFEIRVNTTGANPDAARFIFLGQVDLTSGKQAVTSNISVSGKDYCRTSSNRIKVETNNVSKTDRPAAYSIGQNKYFLDDHVKSVGSGTITNKNPHGLTVADMGVSIYDTIESHRRQEHAPVILTPTLYPTSSAMSVNRTEVTPGNDSLIVKALTAGEFVIINGITYQSTDFQSDVAITFVGDASNVYNIYYDTVTKTVAKTTSDISTDVTKFWLATVTWDATTPGDGNLSAVLDRRRFGGNGNLMRWTTAGRPSNSIASTCGYNLDTGTQEYYNGSAWVTVAGAGAGPVSTITGEIRMWPTGSPPSGWLFCQGQAVSRTTYADLYAVIGTTFGTGDGSTTFNIPDFRGRSPMGTGQGDTAQGGGTGSNRTLAQKTGAETHTLVVNEMPSHSHTYDRPSIGGGFQGTGPNTSLPLVSPGSSVGSTGGSQAHNNMSPVLGINFIIKA